MYAKLDKNILMIMKISKLKKSEPFEAESIAGGLIFNVINPSSLRQAAFLNRTLSNPYFSLY